MDLVSELSIIFILDNFPELVLMSPYSDPFEFEVRFGTCFQVDDIISLAIASLLMVIIQVSVKRKINADYLILSCL